MQIASVAAAIVFASGCKPEATIQPDETGSSTPGPSVAQILAASDLVPTQHVTVSGDPFAVTVHRLENGLTVYFSPDPSTRRVEARIVVRAGSRDDPKDTPGVAHALEHMLFKGTDEIGTLDFASERVHLAAIEDALRRLEALPLDADTRELVAQIEQACAAAATYQIANHFSALQGRLGITETNAYTNADTTFYVSSLPTHRLPEWAALERERFAEPSFRQLWQELEVIIEEKNSALAEADQRFWGLLNAATFQGHPYALDGLGDVRSLLRFRIDAMRSFYRSHYVPNNMAVILAGDVDVARDLALLERTLGTWTPMPLNPRGAQKPNQVEGIVRATVKEPGPRELTAIWLVPAWHQPDAPALEIAARLLDIDGRGLLEEAVRRGIGTASASASYVTHDLAAQFMIQVGARQGQSLADLDALWLDALESLKTGDYDDELLEIIRTEREVERMRMLESNYARSDYIADAYVVGLSWPEALAAMNAASRVTKDQITSAAQTYLKGEYVRLERERGLPPTMEIHRDASASLPLKAAQPTPYSEELVRKAAKLPPADFLVMGRDYLVEHLGVHELIAVNHHRNGLFSATWTFDRGFRDDPLICLALDAAQLSPLLSGKSAPRVGTSNGPDFKQAQTILSGRLAPLGSILDIACDAEEVHISLEGLESQLEPSVAWLRNMLERSSPHPAMLRDLAYLALEDRVDDLSDSALMLNALSSVLRFGDQSAWLKLPPRHRLLSATPSASLKSRRRLLREAPRMTYFGTRAVADVAPTLILNASAEASKPAPPRTYVTEDAPLVIGTYHLPGEQAWISIDIPLGASTDARLAGAWLIDEWFQGAQGGALFHELRETQGLAYSVDGYVATASRAGDSWALHVSLTTHPSKVVQAIGAVLELVKRGPDQQQIEQAIAGSLEQLASDDVELRSIAPYIQSTTLAGSLGDPRAQVYAALSTGDRAGLDQLLTQIRAAKVRVSVVGDLKRIDLGPFASSADVRSYQSTELVGGVTKADIAATGVAEMGMD